MVVSLVLVSSCKTNFNQTKNNLQHGRWITIDTFETPYTIHAKYRKGKEVGTWKYLEAGKLVKKEKHKRAKCYTEYYYSSGKLMKKGYTKYDNNEKDIHWYYQGDWFFYDENGKLQYIKTFEKGELIRIDSLSF